MNGYILLSTVTFIREIAEVTSERVIFVNIHMVRRSGQKYLTCEI